MRISVLVCLALCTLPPSGNLLAASAYADQPVRAGVSGSDDYRFEPVMPLPAPVALHTATLLTSGQVVTAGGFSSSGTSGTAALFDPVERSWTATGSLNEARLGHAAVRLPSGDVLAIGGDGDAGSLASTERYDALTGQWSLGAPLTTPRDRFATAVLGDGRVLVSGGDNLQGGSGIVLDSVEIYDPGTAQWQAAAPLAEARMSHAAATLASGKVLVFGGYSAASNAALASAELYDPATNHWSAAAPLPQPRLGATATRLPSGEVLVVGGAAEPFGAALDSAVIYDPATNQWRTTPPLGYGRNSHSASLLPSGQVLVAGGGNALDMGPTGTAELYDPIANTWTPAAMLATRRFSHEATTLASGEVLISGGQIPVSKAVYTDAAELFTHLGSAVASAAPALLTFSAQAGATATATLTLANTGAATTTLRYTVGESPLDCLDAGGDVAWLHADPARDTIGGGHSVAVTVTFDASRLAAGAYSASLCIATNDATQPKLVVPVQAVVKAAADTIFSSGFEAVQPVQDPSFEATSVEAPAWTGSDSGGDPGTTPFLMQSQDARSGSWALHLGGRFTATLTQSAVQTVTIPAGAPRYLNYWRSIVMPPEGAAATLTISLDGQAVETTDLTGAEATQGYVAQSIDIGRHADGATHRLEIRYDYAQAPDAFAFDGFINIDDVTIDTAPASR